MESVDGKIAFITGAASGIGLGMTKAFTAAGMKVVMADIEEKPLIEAAEKLKMQNRDVHAIRLDVSDRAAFARAADEAEARYGKVHILCNNAGVGGGGPLDTATYDDWDWVMGVNLEGVIAGLVTFLKRIKAHGEGGHVVNTASMAGHMAGANMGIYNATKYAVVGLSESLAQDVAAHGIGVSILCPGLVATKIASGERNRPAALAARGMAATPEMRERGVKLLAAGIDPDKVGERVLDAILKNELYIFTHPEYKEIVRMRMERILAAFGPAADPARGKTDMDVIAAITGMTPPARR